MFLSLSTAGGSQSIGLVLASVGLVVGPSVLLVVVDAVELVTSIYLDQLLPCASSVWPMHVLPVCSVALEVIIPALFLLVERVLVFASPWLMCLSWGQDIDLWHEPNISLMLTNCTLECFDFLSGSSFGIIDFLIFFMDLSSDFVSLSSKIFECLQHFFFNSNDCINNVLHLYIGFFQRSEQDFIGNIESFVGFLFAHFSCLHCSWRC